MQLCVQRVGGGGTEAIYYELVQDNELLHDYEQLLEPQVHKLFTAQLLLYMCGWRSR